MLDLLIIYAILATLGYVFTVGILVSKLEKMKAERDYYMNAASQYYNLYINMYMKGVEKGYVESSEVTY